MTVGQLTDVLSRLESDTPVVMQIPSEAQLSDAKMLADGQFLLVCASAQWDVEHIPVEGCVQARAAKSTRRLVLCVAN